MAISFWKWLTGKSPPGELPGEGGGFREVDCSILFDAASDYVLRKFAFDTCVDLIASALGRVDFRTYENGRETFGREWWTWNVEPNRNQNSTAFLHKFVDQLYRRNEALILQLPVRGEDRTELVVADDWQTARLQVTAENRYYGVLVNDLPLKRVFHEADVLHIKLNNRAMEPVLAALGDSWGRMAAAAQKQFEWDRGQHWKVHVNQIASGAKDFEANFAKALAEQVKPFFENPSAVLPEFDGYEYTQAGGSDSGSSKNGQTEDIRKLADDIFKFTARGFLIPVVLVDGSVEATADANQRFLTYALDPQADQLQEEINRKRFGFDLWHEQNMYMRVDTSAILHYDLFANAASIEKLIGSGYSPNEVRRAAGQPLIPEPWANEHYLTKNTGTMAAAGETASAGEGTMANE